MDKFPRPIFQTSAVSSLTKSPAIAVHLICLFSFAVLTVLFSWPLATDFGNLLGGTNDPPLFTWILATVSESLWSNPTSWFEGDIFYPYGRSITFSEPLLFPALTTGAPVLGLTDNPILAYNVSLVFFQTLSAWAAWFAVYRISGSGAGAVLAGVVYAYSSFKLGYYNFINIHLSFAVPLAFVSAIAFIEGARLKYMLITVLLVWVQAGSIWYGAIPLGFVLILLLLVYVLLRPGLWILDFSWRMILGAVLLALLVAPIALPYFETHSEMNFVRDLGEVNKFRADLLSFLDPGSVNRWGRWIDAGREPGLFAGFVCMTLAVLAILCAVLRIIMRNRGVVRWASFTLICLFTACIARLGSDTYELLQAPSPAEKTPLPVLDGLPSLLHVMFASGLALFLVSGLSWRRGRTTRSVRWEEWVLVTGWLTLISILLVLGPTMHLAGRPLGAGIYEHLFEYLPGFNGLRIAIRLAFVYLFFIGLLAAFAIRLLQTKIGNRHAWLFWLLPVFTIIELWPAPLNYERFNWNQPPAVYQKLADLSEPGVVIELPTFDEHIDSTYMLWALKHGRPIVNGVSGFYPPHIQRLATLTRSLPRRPNVEPLQNIHGLRYLVVHLDRLPEQNLADDWSLLSRRPPQGLEFIDRFDDALLFEVLRPSTPGWRWQRTIPSAMVKARNKVDFSIRLATDVEEKIEHSVELSINNNVVDQMLLSAGANKVVATLPTIESSVHPVAIELHHSYRLQLDTSQDKRYAIGETNSFSPVDIVVESASAKHGSLATIWVNGINHSPRQPGYNVVIVNPADGRRIHRAAFDVSKNADKNRSMTEYIRNAAKGSIVIIALKARGFAELDATGIEAFKLIGAGAVDFGDKSVDSSHLVIGIRGAASGDALEIAEDRLIHYTIGVDRRGLGMTVENFEIVE